MDEKVFSFTFNKHWRISLRSCLIEDHGLILKLANCFKIDLPIKYDPAAIWRRPLLGNCAVFSGHLCGCDGQRWVSPRSEEYRAVLCLVKQRIRDQRREPRNWTDNQEQGSGDGQRTEMETHLKRKFQSMPAFQPRRGQMLAIPATLKTIWSDHFVFQSVWQAVFFFLFYFICVVFFAIWQLYFFSFITFWNGSHAIQLRKSKRLTLHLDEKTRLLRRYSMLQPGKSFLNCLKKKWMRPHLLPVNSKYSSQEEMLSKVSWLKMTSGAHHRFPEAF